MRPGTDRSKERILKKAFALWKKTTDWYWVALPLLLAGGVLPFVFLWVRPRYIQRINELFFPHQWAAFLFVTAAALLSMFITFFKVMSEAVRNDFQMAYWVVLTKRDFYVYILLKKLPWYYIFLIVLLLAGGGLWGNDLAAICITTVVYLVFAFVIYLWNLHILYRGGGFQRRKNKARLVKKRKIDGYSHPNLELIFLGWQYRYLSLESLLCKSVILGISIFLLYSKLPDQYCTVVFVVLFFMLNCVDDNYWKREMANTMLFRNMGISFERYFLIHTVSGILFYSILLSMLYGLASGSVLKGVFFLLGTVLLVCYWNAAYLYLYLSEGEHMDMLKQIYLITMLVVMFIPVVNLAMGVFLWSKVRKLWRSTPC